MKAGGIEARAVLFAFEHSFVTLSVGTQNIANL